VGENDQEVRLHISEPDEQGEYAALSHCWGSGHPETLTKGKLSKMTKSIVLDSASRTFQDAIGVTRRLGIPYLWVDSLCIIQDDDDGRDWQLENSRMGDLYNNATVTICAAASASTENGLFVKPDDRIQVNKSIELSCSSPDGKSGTIYARIRHKTGFDIFSIVHSSQEPETPYLESRGW
jgi:hypothetical protein